MVSYDLLTFDEIAFKEEIMRICDRALNEAVEVIRKNEYFKNGEIKYLPLHNEYDGYVEVSASNLKAWLVEYGTGKYMRQDNPYLHEYKNSKYYYNLRKYKNDAVVYRGKQEYTQLDYEGGDGEITRTGSNPAGKETGTDTQPEPFLENLIKDAWKAFENYYNNAIKSVDYSYFIRVSNQNM